VTLSAHPTFADFVPSKMIDYMAIGKPIALAAQGEAARLLSAAGGGLAVPPGDGKALAEALLQLETKPREGSAMGARGRDWAQRRLRSIQAERMEQVLTEVVG